MINNEDCDFYSSLVNLLEGFFEQDGAQRMKLFWVGVPSENNTHSLEAMFSWRVELNGQQFNGNCMDDAWPEMKFNGVFWGCFSNYELTQKIKNIIIEHNLLGKKEDNLKSIWGLTFIKDNWRQTVIDNIGYFALNRSDCLKLRNIVESNLNHSEEKINADFDENSSFKL